MSRYLPCLLAPALILLLSSPASPRNWLVYPDGSGDAPTIQAAVESLDTHDNIELADGVFSGPGNRDIYSGERWFYVRSKSGDPTACIIDLGGTESEHHFGFGFYGNG